MDRRDFLRYASAAGALNFAGGLPGPGSLAHAAELPALGRRVLVNMTLKGGPDMRYLLPPAFDPVPGSYGFEYWKATAAAHGIGDSSAAFEARWYDDYTPAGAGGLEFGIPATCAWLRDMWERGKVAIVCNVLASPTRDHAHGLLALNQGNHRTGSADFSRSGWGGRLGDAGGGNVLALTEIPSPFLYGPHPDDPARYRTDRIIAAADTRGMALFSQPGSATERRALRALSAYYAAKNLEMPQDSPYRRFVDMEAKLRQFGQPIDERLQDTPVPAEIEALYASEMPRLFDPSFGGQIRDLHDVLACSDILDPIVASMEYGGFDTHTGQREELEPRLVDLFGEGMALDALHRGLPSAVRDNLVFVLAGEFGRQIRANGDGGTDHGQGNVVLVIGESVRGGIYGEMFPEAELDRLQDPTPQIAGLTAMEHVFGRVCEWIQPGSGDVVFPERATSPLEQGVDLGGLFA